MTAVIADTAIVGAPVDRVDGPAKVTGAARYPSDVWYPDLSPSPGSGTVLLLTVKAKPRFARLGSEMVLQTLTVAVLMLRPWRKRGSAGNSWSSVSSSAFRRQRTA